MVGMLPGRFELTSFSQQLVEHGVDTVVIQNLPHVDAERLFVQ